MSRSTSSIVTSRSLANCWNWWKPGSRQRARSDIIRIHGDCHRNNVLWTAAGPHFVDLDDCMMGPAVQDLWMLIAGGPDEMRGQLADILEGYAQFASFDTTEIALIEPLRALRMVHYAAWLARRWHDPAFPRAFPWFGEARYWERHVAELEEQGMAMSV